jgi:GTP pyrophosphokinase
MFEIIEDKIVKIKKKYAGDESATILISNAYEFAKELHKGQVRKSGEPYLLHPVEVAGILANLGFDEDVICAALLHDVIEDCGCTEELIAKKFNQNIADLVDCVSEIDKEKFVFDKDDLFELTEFEKSSIEEQSFKKLIALGKKKPLGFCIKFADRLHNLRTIACFDFSKQLEKVKETEKWILPLAKILNTEYFYRSIKNECFKIVHKQDGVQFFDQYQNYHNVNKKHTKALLIKLKELFANSCIKQIELKEVREYKVYEDLTKLLKKNINIVKVSQGQILQVTNYNLYLLYDNEEYKDVLDKVWNLVSLKNSNVVKIIDAKIGNFTNKPYFQIADKWKNKYNLYIMSNSDYISQQIGTLDGQLMIDNENLDSLDIELIKVRAENDDIIYVPKGSTVLDFAFKFRKEIGFGFKYAIINGSKSKATPYTKLFHGDKVEIVVSKDNEGKIINNAQLKWFAYVNTDYAKKILIKHFEKNLN